MVVFMPKEKIIKLNKDERKIMLGAIKKALQNDFNVMKKRQDELRIVRLIDEKKDYKLW